jgi:SAM-dependent methyltransferase
METEFNNKDKNKIQKAIRKKYIKVAKSPDGFFKYPTGKPGLEASQYEPEIIRRLPENVMDSYCGVGNPFSLGPINDGEKVLDVGCGAGVDTIIAALMVGSTGEAFGIDVISEMLKKARSNLSQTGIDNVTFQEASAENISFADQHFDVAISNGAFNLIPDKTRALSEVYRVLKPAGRLMMADNILIGEIPGDTKQIIKSWSR